MPGLRLIATRSSRRSLYRRDASQRLRQHRLRPSQQSRDRFGPGKNLHPMPQSRNGSSTRDNEQMIERAPKRLRKRAKRGLRGYPLATVALYGPNDTSHQAHRRHRAGRGCRSADLRRWFSESADIRNDAGVAEEVLAFIDSAGARFIVMTDRIIGCPHEEGIDYEGPTCPACPFWAGRDRWTGNRLH
jgi:hypothetical protein